MAARRQYASHLDFLATDVEARRELVREKMSRGWCIGGRDFKQGMRAEAKERGAELERFAGLEPEVIQAERIAVWEERLIAMAAGISLTELPVRKSHPHKVLLAAALKQTTSVNNGWLARRLGMGAPASASQFIRRLRLKEHGPSEIASLLSRVET